MTETSTMRRSGIKLGCCGTEKKAGVWKSKKLILCHNVLNIHHIWYLLTYFMEQSSSWEANCFAANKKFPAFYGTRKFITLLTRARHLSLFSAYSIQSPQPLPTSPRSILILSSHLRFGLLKGLFPSGFPTKTLYMPLPIRAKCPAYLILPDFITRTILGEEYRSLSSSLCNFLHSPVTPSLLGPNILLNTLFSNTLTLMFLPQCQRPSFTSIQNNRQNYSSIYLDLQIFE